MTTLQKVLLGIVAVITVMLLFVAVAPSKSKVGGVYNQVANYFYDGINVGKSNQFAVSNAGVLTTSGAITATGAVSIGGSSAGVNYYRSTIATNATSTLAVSQSGSIVYISGGQQTYTLPALTNGVEYTFVISGALTNDAVVTSAAGDDIEGSLIVAGAVVDCTANDSITFVSDGEDVGDFFTLRSNGTKWFIGPSNALTASKLTCTG